MESTDSKCQLLHCFDDFRSRFSAKRRWLTFCDISCGSIRHRRTQHFRMGFYEVYRVAVIACKIWGGRSLGEALGSVESKTALCYCDSCKKKTNFKLSRWSNSYTGWPKKV